MPTMGTLSSRRLGARILLALMGAIVVVGLFGTAPAAAAPAAGAASSEAAVPLTCEQLLGPDLVAELEASGFVAAPENVSPLFLADAARQCWWFDRDSPRIRFLGAGYTPASSEVVASETARLLAIPSFFQDGDADGIRLRSDGRPTASNAEHVDASWQFQARDGFWFFVVAPDGFASESRAELDARMDDLMERVQLNVITALAPAEQAAPEPSATPVPSAPTAFTADTPSTLSGLQTVQEVALTPASLGGCLAVAIVLAALVGLPGRLVDSALSARYDEWTRALAPVSTATARLRAAIDRMPRLLVLAGGLVVASVFAAFVEPELGLNGGSVRLVLSILAGMVVENLLGLALIAVWLARRGQASRLALRPGSLVIVLLTALLSRAGGFEPGFVFGLVLAVVLAGTVSEEREAEASVAEGAWLLVLGFAGWLAYSGMVGAGWGESDAVGLFAVETLAAVTVGCLSALPLVTLPLAGLPGRALWRRSRLLWAGAQAVAVAVFVFVVLPFPQSWEAVETPFIAWIVAFAVYAAVAVALWAVLSFTPSRWLATAESAPVGSAAAPSTGPVQRVDADAGGQVAASVAVETGADAVAPEREAPPRGR